ncbi:hypothetical protein MXB_550, partial [Myxobolus squamalis]
VTVYDLKKNNNYSFETKNRKNIQCLGLSPNDSMLLTIDEEGHCVCSSLKRRMPIHFFNLNAPVKQVKFSPDNKYVAFAVHDKLHIFLTPASEPKFRPFVLLQKYGGFTDKISCLDWSDNSRFICTGAIDMSVRIVCVLADENSEFSSPLLRGLKQKVIAVFFEKNSLNLFAVDIRGFLIKWKY